VGDRGVDADRKTVTIALCCLAVLTGLFFFEALQSGRLFFYLDHGFQNIPFRHYAFSRIFHDGRMPLWCPYAAAGFPLFAEGQSGASYLPIWPFFAILSFALAYNCSLVAHVLWMSIGLYLLFRKCRYISVAALSGAICCTYSGYVIRKLMFVNYIQALSWIPWLLLIITFRPGFKKNSALQTIIPGSVILALICFAGHPQVIFIAISVFWFYGLFGPVCIPLRQRIIVMAAVTVSGLILGAGQILPTAGLVIHSTRSFLNSRNMFSAQMPLPPAYLPNLFLNDPFGNAAAGTFDISRWPAYEWELNIFIGITAFSLALAAPLTSRRVRFFWACVFTGLFLSLGSFSLSTGILQYIPFADLFRAPARWALLIIFGFSGLLTHTVNGLGTEDARRTCRLFFTRSLPVLLALCAAGWLIVWRNGVWKTHPQMQKAFYGAFLYLIFIALLLLARWKTRYRQLVLLIPFAIFSELFWANHVYPSSADETLLLEKPEGLDFIENRDARVLSLYHSTSPLVTENWHGGWIGDEHGDYAALKDTFPMYSGMLHEVRLLTFDEWSPLHYSGYTRWALTARKLEPHIIRYFNIRYVCSPSLNRLFRGRRITGNNNWVIDEIPEGNRGKTVQFRVPVFTGADEAQIMASIAERPVKDPEILIRGQDIPLKSRQWCLNGDVSMDQQDHHQKELTVLADTACCVVISEAFDRGWTAAGSTGPFSIYRGDLLFQTLLLPAGHHTVSLRYQPVSYRLGLFISLMMLFFLVCLFMMRFRLCLHVSETLKPAGNPRFTIMGFYIWVAIVLVMITAGFIFHNDIWNDSLANWFL
jgi:hypothetical protein